MAKKKPSSRAQQAILRYSFEDGDHNELLIEATARAIQQYAKMANSEESEIRKAGQEKIKEIARLAVEGEFHLRDQANRANNPRSTIEDDNGERTSVTDIAKYLRKRFGDLKPAEMWPHFISDLDKRGLAPREDVDVSSGKKEKIVIYGDGKKTTISAFRATLSTVRKDKN